MLQSGIVVDSAAGGRGWRNSRWPRPLCRRTGRSTRRAAAWMRASAGIAAGDCPGGSTSAGGSTGGTTAGLAAAAGIAAGRWFGSALDGTRLNRRDRGCGRNGNWGRYGFDRWRRRGWAAGRRRDISGPVGCHGGRDRRVGGLQVLRLRRSGTGGEARRFGCSGSAFGCGAGFLCGSCGGSCRCGGRRDGLADTGAGCRARTWPGRDPGCGRSADLRTGGADCGFRWPDCRVAWRYGSWRRCWGSGSGWVGRRARGSDGGVTGQGCCCLRRCLGFP